MLIIVTDAHEDTLAVLINSEDRFFFLISHDLEPLQVRAFKIRLKGHAVFPVIGVNALLHQFRQLLYS